MSLARLQCALDDPDPVQLPAYALGMEVVSLQLFFDRAPAAVVDAETVVRDKDFALTEQLEVVVVERAVE
ncbi:hypothetical protein D9M70_548850 [compost metagenome]